MCPYDTLVWGESQAANGLTGLAALTGQNHSASGDDLTLKSTPEPPVIHGLGSLSDTKPRACAVLPKTSNGNKRIYGPGGIDFWGNGWAQWMRDAPIELQKGDTLTGQHDNTNVSEGGVVGVDMVYGGMITPWTLADIRKNYSRIYSQAFSITSATAVTFNDAAGALDTLTDDDLWLDKKASYDILGVGSFRSGATFGGILNILGLGGDWQGFQPGLIANPLSAVTFNAGAEFAPVLEPIPFDGDSLPTMGMTATSAGAYLGILVLGQKG